MAPEVKRYTNVRPRSPRIAQNEFLWAFSDSAKKNVPETSQAHKRYQTFSMLGMPLIV